MSPGGLLHGFSLVGSRNLGILNKLGKMQIKVLAVLEFGSGDVVSGCVMLIRWYE